MSLIKRTKLLRSESIRRQSFSERICDDLSEVILQYLSLEDKLRLECVSKQFQKTIFIRHHYLWLNNSYFLVDTKFNFNGFETVLKKCRNIKSILSVIHYYRFENDDLLADLIFKYCHYLNEFNTRLVLNKKSWNKLITKINSKSFTFWMDSINENPCISFESLSFVKDLRIKYFYGFTLISNVIKMKNLRSVKIIFSSNECFKTFAKNNANLKSLQILTKDSDLNYLVKEISKFKNLIELKIWSDCRLTDNSFSQYWNQLADNCLNLKSILCELIVNPDPSLSSIDTISSLKNFKSLKRLNITFTRLIADVGSIPFQLFDGFKNLTHLTINTNSELTTDLSLNDVNVFLPKLRFLKINSEITANKETVLLLGSLSSLESIDIKITDNSIRQQIYETLLKKCPRIRLIRLN